MLDFIAQQPSDFVQFDHFTFIKNYVNPLFKINQQLIRNYSIQSNSYNDFSLNNSAESIFDKNLYLAQDIRSIYRPVMDSISLDEIRELGKLLFYDPLLSGNNKRSCASCHIPQQYFTDTSIATPLQFDQTLRLNRNAPSLINADKNQLIMLDGRHISLVNQSKDVITNLHELGSREKDLLKKVLSCKEYKIKLKKLASMTADSEVGFKHITAALIVYYSSFSSYNSTFDNAMNQNIKLDSNRISGFNLFMSKAQCGTCHFAPLFNGVKPPYISSEFEVLGVPEDTAFLKLSYDEGRYIINPVYEMKHAFRTGTLRNINRTKPYMHNGIFKNLKEVIEFYDAGGGLGKGLKIENQTLSRDSLHLSENEKLALINFLETLDEKIPIDKPPHALPISTRKELNTRKVGGAY
jgi:cytochrome c peroxidase